MTKTKRLAFTVMGVTVRTAEEARFVMEWAKADGLDHVVRQCLAIIPRLP